MVAIIYPYLPHYRYPVFSLLCRSKTYNFTLIAGCEPDVEMRTIDPGWAGIPVDKGGLRWEFVKNIWIFNKKLLWQKGLLSKCFEKEYDAFVFLGDVYYLTTWIYALLLRIKGKKVFYWTHGVYEEEKGIKNLIRLLFYKIPHGLMLYGHHAAEILEKKGFTKNNLRVIYNSLDYEKHIQLRNTISRDELLQFRSRFFADSSLPQIIFIGRLIRKKKIHQIIEAVKILFDQNFRINALIVGEGDEESGIRSLVKRMQLDQYVHFYGPSYEEDENYKLIAGSDVCVSPGEVGLTAIHAMTFGTPVITHNNFSRQGPEFEVIEPGITGDYFEMDNINDLSRKIRKWLTQDLDKEKIRQNCQRVVDEKYNPAVQHDIICNVLREVAKV